MSEVCLSMNVSITCCPLVHASFRHLSFGLHGQRVPVRISVISWMICANSSCWMSCSRARISTLRRSQTKTAYLCDSRTLMPTQADAAPKDMNKNDKSSSAAEEPADDAVKTRCAGFCTCSKQLRQSIALLISPFLAHCRKIFIGGISYLTTKGENSCRIMLFAPLVIACSAHDHDSRFFSSAFSFCSRRVMRDANTVLRCSGAKRACTLTSRRYDQAPRLEKPQVRHSLRTVWRYQ